MATTQSYKQLSSQAKLIDEEKRVEIEMSNYIQDIDVSMKAESILMTHDATHDNYVLGTTFILLSVAVFSLMSFFAKLVYYINPDMTSWDIFFMRGWLSMGVIWLQTRWDQVDCLNFKSQGINLALAVITMFLCYAFQTLSFEYISVAKAALIIYSNPVLVVVLAYFFFKENVTRFDIIAVILVLGGCYLVI